MNYKFEIQKICPISSISVQKVNAQEWFFYYHNDSFLGLACNNSKVSSTKKSEWVYPTVAKKKEHAKKINKLV